nr:hypothetical protein [Tanacetum cinerariifolium]
MSASGIASLRVGDGKSNGGDGNGNGGDGIKGSRDDSGDCEDAGGDEGVGSTTYLAIHASADGDGGAMVDPLLVPHHQMELSFLGTREQEHMQVVPARETAVPP